MSLPCLKNLEQASEGGAEWSERSINRRQGQKGKESQIRQGLVGHQEDFDFYSKVGAMECCRQRRNVTWLRGSRVPSGCCRENRPKVGQGKGKRGSRRTLLWLFPSSWLETWTWTTVEGMKGKRSDQTLDPFWEKVIRICWWIRDGREWEEKQSQG